MCLAEEGRESEEPGGGGIEGLKGYNFFGGSRVLCNHISVGSAALCRLCVRFVCTHLRPHMRPPLTSLGLRGQRSTSHSLHIPSLP